jgi:valyl-tRNA synthetase
MPLITEEIWQALRHTGESFMIAKFRIQRRAEFSEEEKEFGRVV